MVHKIVGHDHSYFLRQESAFFCTEGFLLDRRRNLPSFEHEVGDLDFFTLLVTYCYIPSSFGQGGYCRGVCGRSSDSEFFELLDKRCLGIPCRGSGEFAFGTDLPVIHPVPDFHLREDYLLVVVCRVVRTFDIEFQESVEQYFCGLYGKFLGSLVRGYLYVSAADPGICHLACHCPLPYQLIQLLLFRSALNAGVLYESRSDGFVRFLRSLCLGLVLSAFVILFPEGLADVFLGSVQREGGQVGGVGTHVGDVPFFIQLLSDAHGAADGHAQLPRCLLLKQGSGEWRCRCADAVFLLDAGYGEIRPDAFLEECPCGIDVREPGVECCLDCDIVGSAVRVEDCVYLIIMLFLEVQDFPFLVHNKAEGH